MSAILRKLQRLELTHLRQHALELSEQLEQAKAEVARAYESVEFWQAHAMQLQEALYEGPSHLCVGITKTGETVVIERTPHE